MAPAAPPTIPLATPPSTPRSRNAAESGASILKIQETSRHKSTDVLAGYVRRVDMFKDHAGAAFL